MANKTKYLVDVFRTYAKCVEIEAESDEEAEEIAFNMTRRGEIDPASFEMTDDVDTECCGIVGEDGERHYN